MLHKIKIKAETKLAAPSRACPDSELRFWVVGAMFWVGESYDAQKGAIASHVQSMCVIAAKVLLWIVALLYLNESNIKQDKLKGNRVSEMGIERDPEIRKIRKTPLTADILDP